MDATNDAKTTITYPDPDDSAFIALLDLDIPRFSTLKEQSAAIISDSISVFHAQLSLQVIPRCRAKYGGIYEDAMVDFRWKFDYLVDKGQACIYGGLSLVHNQCILCCTYGVPENAYRRRFQSYTKNTVCLTKDSNTSDMAHIMYIDHNDIWPEVPGRVPLLVLPDDVLEIHLEIRSVSLALEPGTRHQCAMTESLSKKNLRLYNSTTGRDFVLVSADGTERPVHKVILEVASPVFERMFASNMKECQTGRCVIEDISTKTLDALLRYMCYEGLENLKEEAVGLLEAAEKYEMADLKGYCEKELIAGINMENVADLLFLADKFSATGLKQAAHRFIVKNFDAAMDSGPIDNILERADASVIKELLAASRNEDLD